ncbi:hypothetical protein GZH47_02030 [Paenibacillus rhizovicinus]|uniref:Uncharacterized protein n=1 Tax=Paenibacillus rhizovicinus TaxID=2704463 RepID=A0A6C0NUY1_9BACL|nr:hypothetical protein [Paenibacillus rhizovicinus]QHW29736.1 hypothetical protein GZH47_02030 [Paenibacillus rhizovicinus]
MYVFSIFEHSLKLELAISELEQHRIQRKEILAVPMKKQASEKTYFDPYNLDGLNLFLVSATATIIMLLGVIYGYSLYWGPIIWGLIGLIAGTAIGFIIDKVVKTRSRRKKLKTNISDVILVVNCNETNKGVVEDILISHQALSVAFVGEDRTE